MNKESLAFFTAMACEASISEESVKINAVNNHSEEDARFVLQYSTKESSLLDLASGTGLLINKIYPYLKRIVAVERFKEFTQFIARTPTITIVHDDIMQFTTEEQFDIITCFGIMHYFSKEEAIALYTHYYKNIKDTGKLIIKQQFGVYEDVKIKTKLEHIVTKEYYSEYRTVEHEIAILQAIGYKDIDVIDIYPPHYNRWKNTHFFAIVAGI